MARGVGDGMEGGDGGMRIVLDISLCSYLFLYIVHGCWSNGGHTDQVEMTLGPLHSPHPD